MTIKQSKALTNWLENGGNRYRAMISAGYSHSMAKNPQKLFKSKHIRVCLSEYNLTHEKVLQSLSEVLESGSVDEKLMVARFCLGM